MILPAFQTMLHLVRLQSMEWLAKDALGEVAADGDVQSNQMQPMLMRHRITRKRLGLILTPMMKMDVEIAAAVVAFAVPEPSPHRS
jgi:hypothetical protein